MIIVIGLLKYLFTQCCSERALLNRLMIELYKLDSDVLVGHNISGFDLDVLLHRAQVGISTKCFTLERIYIYLLHILSHW